MDTKVLTTVNGISIVELADSLIPIKPICEALGINFSSQLQKIKSDKILAPIMVQSTTVGADNKNREMACLPLKYIFGWLFTINPGNVQEEAQDKVIQYKKECYDAIYDSLFLSRVYLKEVKDTTDDLEEELELHRSEFKNAQDKLKNTEAKLKAIKALTFEEWKHKRNQTSLLENNSFIN
ncbi:phage antirepressor N-terminal domain-containing protein [Myroides odoratimimus]|uniref:phage antirepressor N-terminal domain-containing protein n=1 Tax=Myroides odoratimimus TaxID=76832 RepID=UPI0026DFD1E1|nr:phage antirepressor N-terminal domain-containing protein [Myroides odoratimimus]MDO5858943.1 phage antirepressor N-terminal domain-containing protein [Myroides odoratimimus]